jgi:hypothetical protein
MNCEDGHECRLLNKKTDHKSQDRESSYEFMNTSIQKRIHVLFREATALIGLESLHAIALSASYCTTVKSSLNGEPFSLNPYSELGAHRFKSRIYGKSEEKVSYCQLKYTVLYVTYLYVGPIAKIYSACLTLHSRRYTVRVYWPTNK